MAIMNGFGMTIHIGVLTTMQAYLMSVSCNKNFDLSDKKKYLESDHQRPIKVRIPNLTI